MNDVKNRIVKQIQQNPATAMNWLLVLACIPLVWRITYPLLPASITEPYAYWDPSLLNTAVDNRLPRWRNMGYWDNTTDFTAANEALARRLLTFADAKTTGNTLDMAHGEGESLLIHLKTGPPNRLDALTSLASETHASQILVGHWQEDYKDKTDVTWFTMSASYRANKDFDHPLNPMRGFTGSKRGGESEPEPKAGDVYRDAAEDQVIFDDADFVGEGDENIEAEHPAQASQAPEPYDLVYVLDAAYHFPPGIGYFAASVLPVLRPGSGVLAYTDVVPPPSFSKWPLSLVTGWVAPVAHLPNRNLNARPKTIEAYAEMLEKLGYVDVKIEDWSSHVFPGLSANLQNRGLFWTGVAQTVKYAHRFGWKFLAVRGVRPDKA